MTPSDVQRSATVERFWAKVQRGADDECWPWVAGVNGRGYGSFFDGSKDARAHRFAYELMVGPIPKGLVIDHLCRNRLCVNPAHMEPVTNKENSLRGEGAPARHARKTHCERGHEFNEANTRLYQGTRCCRTCLRLYRRAYRAAPKGEDGTPTAEGFEQIAAALSDTGKDGE